MSNEQGVVSIEVQAAHLVKLAEELGFVVTITNEPLMPLAMGNYRAVINVWPAKSADGVSSVRLMPPRAPGLYDPKDEATLAEDREAYALINSTPLLQSLLYDINLLPEQLGRDGKNWCYMHAVVSHFSAMKRLCTALAEETGSRPGADAIATAELTTDDIAALSAEFRRFNWDGDYPTAFAAAALAVQATLRKKALAI